MKPVIGFSMGDPHGIGPEVLLKALSSITLRSKITPLIIGDYSYLKFIEKKILTKNFQRYLNLIPVSSFDIQNRELNSFAHSIFVYDLKNIRLKNIKMGKVDRHAGFVSGVYIKKTVELAKKNIIKAIVTAPINKESFFLGGWGKEFVGHTEMLANLCEVKEFALMLMSGCLRAVHVTSHISLKKVASQIRKKNVEMKIRLIDKYLSKILKKKVKIGVSALNPHAGDGGVLGNEEKKEIMPAIQICQKDGILVEGPISPDIIWPMVLNQKYDAGLAMYHDQGQIAVKLLGAIRSHQVGASGVNLTLGLPFIRTSPAHGTAFDIAGKGIASELSMKEAIQTAIGFI